jgi:hypothetical protein
MRIEMTGAKVRLESHHPVVPEVFARSYPANDVEIPPRTTVRLESNESVKVTGMPTPWEMDSALYDIEVVVTFKPKFTPGHYRLKRRARAGAIWYNIPPWEHTQNRHLEYNKNPDSWERVELKVAP